MGSVIFSIQEEIASLLEADPFFADITVLSRKKHEIANDVANQVAKLKVACVVRVAQLIVRSPNEPVPFFEEVRIQVGCVENRTLNNTGKSAEEMAEKAASVLNHRILVATNSPLFLDTPTIVEIPPEKKEDANKALWAVQFKCAAGLTYEIPAVEAVSIVNNAGVVTMTTATANVLIFWRDDGKHPHPREDAGSNLYTAPFAHGAGTILARAWRPGYLPSPLAKLVIP